jgi:hypothetical protein
MLPVTEPVPLTCPLTAQVWPVMLAHGTPDWPVGWTCASACCTESPGPNTTDTVEPASALPGVTPLQVVNPGLAVTGLQKIVSRPAVVEKTAIGT